MATATFFNPKTEYDIKRRQAMAETLRKQSEPKPTEIVSGIAVPQSGLSALAGALGQGVAGYQDARIADLAEKDTRDRQQFLASAVKQYGTDPKMLAQALMTQPSFVDAGLGLYGDTIKGDQMSAYQAAILGLQGRKFEAEYQTNPDTGEVEPRPKEKAMPVSAGGGLLENRSNLVKAQDALALVQGKTIKNASGVEVKGAKSSTGWKGFLPEGLLQRFDPEGVATRASIADLGSMIIHDRSGAAVTASEYPRLKPFIPKETDDDETVAKKLTRFVGEYERLTQEASDFYSESGYKVPDQKIRGGNVVSGGASNPPPTPEELAEFNRLNGGQ